MTATYEKPGGTVAGVSAAIEVSGLRKSFGEHVVLDGIDLSVPEGSVFALLGPNGAGKTTMVRILATLSAADAGEVRVAGHDIVREPMAVRSVIGVTGQFSATDAYLSAEENLLLMADLWHLTKQQGRQRSAELLELFELAGTGRKPVFTFSGGMQRRLDLAMTLMGSPRIIFLDEPTTGLDPRGRRTMWDLIRGLVRDQAVTIFLTTQYLEEADQLASLVAVIDNGQLVAQGTAADLKRRIPGGHAMLTFTSAGALDAAAGQFGDRARRNDKDLTLQVPSDDSARSVQELLSRIDVDSVPHVTLHTPDLDDVFLALTGQAGKDPS
ncbi:MAG: ATP-binding cassette domain-containing protein [Nocardiopsaceae bacterium]|nr:ATP-binding cassette domain-containing protein [Nocardiopsaceae bacterium]